MPARRKGGVMEMSKEDKSAAKGRKSIGSVKAKERAMREAKDGVKMKSRFSTARGALTGKGKKGAAAALAFIDDF